MLRVGDVLVNSTGTGTLGRVAQIRHAPPEPTTIDSHVTIVRPKRGQFHTDFFGYMLIRIENEIEANGEGSSGQTELSRSTLSNKLEVTYPTAIPEQQRIVAILDEAFEGLDRAVANTKQNLANARELFAGCLNAKLGQASDYVELSELAENITDGDHSPPPKAESGIPFITISDIVKRTREIDFSDTFSVPLDYFQALKPYKKPRVGDVLYTVTGATLGIPVLVTEQRDFCFQRHIGLIRPNAGTDSAWLSYALLAPDAFSQATIGSTGTAQKTVSLSVLRAMKLPKMTLAQQRKIAAELDEVAAKTEQLALIAEIRLAALAELKQSILARAFSAKLTKQTATTVTAAKAPALSTDTGEVQPSRRWTLKRPRRSRSSRRKNSRGTRSKRTLRQWTLTTSKRWSVNC